MTRFRGGLRFAAAVGLLPLVAVQQGFAWGAVGHRMMSRLTVQSLPADVPAFLRNGGAADTFEYLAPAPDRQRSKAEEDIMSLTTGDHYIDWEWAELAAVACAPGSDGCTVAGKTFPRHRYDWVRALDKAQAANPGIKMTPENIGTQPWEVEEEYERLKESFREYRKLVAANQDTKPIETEIVFVSAWMAHFVEDGSQPLHATMEYNGWTGPNPNGYTTEHKIHTQFETIYVTANVKPEELTPLIAAVPAKVIADEWGQYLGYLTDSNAQVEKVYQLEKTGAFTGAGTPEGKVFVEGRMAVGVEELRDLIYTAWIRSGDPVEEYKGPV